MVLVKFGRKNLFRSNLVPAGFEPGTFGVTATTNVTVSTNGPRLQVCVLFLQVKYWSLRDSNLGPSGIEPGTFGVTATNVTVSNNGPRSQVKPGHSGPLAFFFQPTFFLNNFFSLAGEILQLTFPFSTDKFVFQPTFCFSNGQKTFFFQMTIFLLFSPPL